MRWPDVAIGDLRFQPLNSEESRKSRQQNSECTLKVKTHPGKTSNQPCQMSWTNCIQSTDNDSAPADTLNYLQAEDHCVMCNAKSARRCLWCQSTSYCSLKCQEEDFTMHKLLCQLIPSFPPRPSPEYVRAIFFPEMECRPQLTWAKHESGVDNFDG